MNEDLLINNDIKSKQVRKKKKKHRNRVSDDNNFIKDAAQNIDSHIQTDTDTFHKSLNDCTNNNSQEIVVTELNHKSDIYDETRIEISKSSEITTTVIPHVEIESHHKRKFRSKRITSISSNHTAKKCDSMLTGTDFDYQFNSPSFLNVEVCNTSTFDCESLSDHHDSMPNLRICDTMPDIPKIQRSADTLRNKTDFLDSAELEDDLLKFFPDRKAKIMVITWNMAEITEYPENFADMIHDTNMRNMCDLYLFCFQETVANKTELMCRIQSTFGPRFVIYDQIENRKLFAILFGHKRYIWNLGIIGKDNLSVRMTTVTKGVAAISFQFFGSSFLFLGSHLSSDTGRNTLRIEDYQTILYSKYLIKSLAVPCIVKGSDESNLSHYFDYTIWAGDLNFRVTLDDGKVRNIINQVQEPIKIESLLEYDELINSQSEGQIFQEFEEGRITFLPSYRFLINSSQYSDKRTPSYTDRILFRSQERRGIEYLYYSSVESIKCSDHKPVRAILEINIEPQKNEYMSSSGKFNEEIYDKCFKSPDNKKAQPKLSPSTTTNSTPQSKMCSIQ